MSELKTNLEQILQEKNEKIISQNIKKDVEVLGVTGSYDKEDIKELQDELADAEQELADVRRDLDNSTTTISGSGEAVTLNGTAEARFKKPPLPRGNSEQVQLTGKNLFKPIPSATRNGITFTNNGDGSYTLNGTATAPTSFYIVNVGYGSGTYALSANNPVTNSGVILQLETSNGNKNTALNAINKTLIDNCDDINALAVIVSNGTTLSNFVIKPQLELGSSVTSYEPYVGGTASPNPDYPQEITNVTGDVEVKVQNKNLFNKDNATSKSNYVKDDNGNDASTGGFSYITSYTKVNSNTTYTLSGKLVNNNGTARIYYYDKNKNWISRSAGFGVNINVCTFTTPQNCEYIQFQYINEAFDIDTIQLEESSTSTPYTSHKEQVLPLTLKSKNLFDKTRIVSTNQGNWEVVQITDGVRIIHKNSYYTGTPSVVFKLKPNTTYTYSQNEAAGFSIQPDGGTKQYANTNQMTITTRPFRNINYRICCS